jgi:hypothetical protein
MTAAREAFTLPLLLLTVTLLGGLRAGDRVDLVPPSLFSLVLAMVLGGALVRSGTLAPDRLMHSERGALANLNGLAVLVTLLVASAQALALVTPDWGLPRIAASVFLFVLLLNTHAASPDRERLLRSLVVIFGSAFILKFVILAALSDPVQGRLARALQVLLEGVTLGSLTQPVYRSLTGYVAFATLVLYLIALALLPRPLRGAWHEAPSRHEALMRHESQIRHGPQTGHEPLTRHEPRSPRNDH